MTWLIFISFSDMNKVLLPFFLGVCVGGGGSHFRAMFRFLFIYLSIFCLSFILFFFFFFFCFAWYYYYIGKSFGLVWFHYTKKAKVVSMGLVFYRSGIRQ